MADIRLRRCPIPRPSPPWRRGWRRSRPARRPSWSGCWSTRRSTPPGTSGKAGDLLDARFPAVCDRPRRPAHLSRPRPAGGLCDARPEAPAARRAGLCRRPRGNGSSARWRPSTCGASGARTASGSGCSGRTRARAMRTRSPPSACGCGAGSRSTASPSMSSRICRISTRSCPAASSDPRYGVTSLADLGHPVSMAEVDIALRQAFDEVFGSARCVCRKRRCECRGTCCHLSAGLQFAPSRRQGEISGARTKSSAAPKTPRLPAADSAHRNGRAARRPPRRAQRRPAPAQRDHVGHGIGRARKQRLDAAVPAVAHPTLEIARASPDARPRRGSRRPAPGPGSPPDGSRRSSISSAPEIRRCASSSRHRA